MTKSQRRIVKRARKIVEGSAYLRLILFRKLLTIYWQGALQMTGVRP